MTLLWLNQHKRLCILLDWDSVLAVMWFRIMWLAGLTNREVKMSPLFTVHYSIGHFLVLHTFICWEELQALRWKTVLRNFHQDANLYSHCEQMSKISLMIGIKMICLHLMSKFRLMLRFCCRRKRGNGLVMCSECTSTWQKFTYHG